MDTVGRGFRARGFAGVGVDGLAKAAGVTSGAFYAHCGSKDGAFAEALETGLHEVVDGLAGLQRENGATWIGAFADYYLGAPHLGNLETGCAMALLTAEVVRFPQATHALFEKKMNEIVAVFAQGLAGGDEADRRARAWASLSVLIGGVNVARALKTPAATAEVAQAVRAAALVAAGKARAIVQGERPFTRSARYFQAQNPTRRAGAHLDVLAVEIQLRPES